MEEKSFRKTLWKKMKLFKMSNDLFPRCFVRNLYPKKSFNSLPNDKISDQPKLKAFTDNKIKAIEKLKFVQGRNENIVGKGENAGFQHFLLFLQCFQKACFKGVVKSRDCVVKG